MALCLRLSSRASKEFEMDLSQLPATHTKKHSRVSGVLLILFSLLWGGIPAAALIYVLVSGQFEREMLFLAVFGIIGAGIFLTGLWLITYRKKLLLMEAGCL